MRDERLFLIDKLKYQAPDDRNRGVELRIGIFPEKYGKILDPALSRSLWDTSSMTAIIIMVLPLPGSPCI